MNMPSHRRHILPLRGRGIDIFLRKEKRALKSNRLPRNIGTWTGEASRPLPTFMTPVAVNGREKIVTTYSHFGRKSISNGPIRNRSQPIGVTDMRDFSHQALCEDILWPGSVHCRLMGPS
jgi:hypothetical protein